MNAFAKLPTDLPIREDLPSAFRNFWTWLAEPGCWWTGPEKLAIAAEVRNARSCEFCAIRKEALSPSMAEGSHTIVQEVLPVAAVDSVHRIVTDATRLTKSWIDETFSGELTDGHYVELLGITVLMISVDQFHRALGLPLENLPDAKPGDPSGYRPSGAEPGVGYVPMIPENKLTPEDADLYAGSGAPNVIRAMSLVPDCVRQMRMLSDVQYIPTGQLTDLDADPGRALDRAQIELVAARVSSINECFY